jgi:hypothetical protein
MSEIQKLRQELKPTPSSTAEQVAAPVSSESSQKQSDIRDEREGKQFDGWEQEEPGEQAGEDDFHDLGRELQQERRADPSLTHEKLILRFATSLDELSSITFPRNLSHLPMTRA